MPTPLEVPRDILEEVYNQARRQFPHECCGWLAGDKHGVGVNMVRPCVNMQTEGGHPFVPDRTAETAYLFGAKDLLELNYSFDSDTPARVIYHSHPNGRAYFSEIDRRVAISPWGDGPAFPVQQLVVGINSLRVVDAALFAWSEDEGDFVQIARFEGADI